MRTEVTGCLRVSTCVCPCDCACLSVSACGGGGRGVCKSGQLVDSPVSPHHNSGFYTECDGMTLAGFVKRGDVRLGF